MINQKYITVVHRSGAPSPSNKILTGCLDLKLVEVAFRSVLPLCKCCAVGKSVNVNFFYSWVECTGK